jgi:hypothetical protein
MRRNFQILAGEQDGQWVEHDRDEVRQLLLDLEGSLHRLGGVVTISAIRQEIGQDTFETTGMIVAYDSFSPAVRREEEAVEDARAD